MKIAFLLGSPDISGGTNVIYEHALRLRKMGHEVSLLTETEISPDRHAWHSEAALLGWNTLENAEDILFDIVIATWWQSVFHLCRLRSRNYVYFIQSIESRFFPARDVTTCELRDIDILAAWCENTYRYPLPVITEARWIQDYLREHYNRPSYLVRNGIRKDIYREDGPAVAPRRPGNLRVLIEGPLGVFFKNVEKTIELCRKAQVDEVWLLTSSPVAEYPGVDRCFSRVPIHKTAEIYRSCDILVKLSYVEGMFGPPLEIFHCGGTAIVYDVTGHDEYIRHGINSLVVERDNEAQVVAWLERLRSDGEFLEVLKAGARATALDWPDWEVAAETFQLALQDCNRESSGVSSCFLAEHNRFLLESRDNSLRERELARMAERERIGGQSDHFLNHIQVYWDCGRGIEAEITDSYSSGTWCRCSAVVPADLPLKALRVDPSVRLGVVEIRELKVSCLTSGKVLAHWCEGDSWDSIAVAGTACILRMRPYPIIEAYGEDPQLFLPGLPDSQASEPLLIELEVREWSFAQALTVLGGIGTDAPARNGLAKLKDIRRGIMRRVGRFF